MKKYFVIDFFLLAYIVSIFNNNTPNQTYVTLQAEIIGKKVLTIEEKHQVFLDMAIRLKNDGLISVSAKKFADFCMVSTHCESGLKTWKDNGGQQGIWQFTPDTRKKNGFPESIVHDNFVTQVGYCEIYLRKVSGRLKYIKSAEDLHIIKFAPYRTHLDVYSKVSNDGLKGLDMDGDSLITRNDFKLFQKKRIYADAHPFVKKIYKNLQKNP